MNKFTIIAISSVIVISSIFYVVSIMPEFSSDTNDKLISESENSHEGVSIHFSPLTKATLIECKGDTKCALDILNDLSRNESQEDVLKAFSDFSFAAQQSIHNCHVLGHELGHFLYDYSGDLKHALLRADRTCGGSYYHGIMQGFFKTNSLSFNGVPSYTVAKNACNELVDVSHSQIRSECAHGVGHGLMVAYNYDALTAINRCYEFEDDFAQRSCAEGAFMENAQRYSKNLGTLDENDLLFPCNVLEEKFEGACYHYHAIYLLNKVNLSIEDAFEQCEKNKNEMHVKHCYYGIGIMSTFYSNYDNDKILLDCQKGNLDYSTYCFAGAIYTTADQMGVDNGFELCQILPEKFKKDCYSNLGKWIHTVLFTEEEIDEYCSQLKNSDYYQVCMDANPNEIGLV